MCGICGILSFNDKGVDKRELFIFRDRIGIKPLYYTIDDQHAVERYHYSIIIMFAKYNER
jgi:asparagine synthetase B (glutamine-hydrolysing)